MEKNKKVQIYFGKRPDRVYIRIYEPYYVERGKRKLRSRSLTAYGISLDKAVGIVKEALEAAAREDLETERRLRR